MKQLNATAGIFGPFSVIETLSDRYRCDGADYQFTVIGAATIEDWVKPPPPPEQVAIAREAKLEEIKAQRDWRKVSGVKVGANWFHSDTFSRTQQLGLVVMGAAVPATPWKTMSGAFVTLTPTLVTQIFQATAASDMNLHAIAEQKKAAMLLLPEPSTYDATSGWPEVFA